WVCRGSGEHALGLLFVNFLEAHYFSDSELEAVNLFAKQAAIAIENARLYENLALRLEESSTLQKVGTSLTDTRDLNLVLDRVLQAAFELIHADEANILFYDEGKDEFRVDALMSRGIGLPLQSYQTRTRQHDGYTYEIIKSKKHVSIPDTTLDPRINPVTLQKGRRAAVGVPLIGRESPVGVLWMHWKTPHQISERDERLLTAIAGQAAVSIENANLFDQLKAENVRRNEESQALQRVGISLTESIELQEVLQRVLQAALELVHGDEDSILFYDEARDEFDSNALMCAGLVQPLQTYQTRVRQRKGLAYQIVKEREPVFIPDTLLDPRISQVAIDKGRRATVGVPLLDHDGPVGVLWVNWKATRQVSSSEASLLTALASQATVAIKGAKRYEEIQRKTAHLEAVHEAGKVISAASVGLDRQQVLDRILEQAIECVTGVDGSKASVGTIQLLEEETNELVVKSVFPQEYPQRSIEKFDHIFLDPKKTQTARIGVTGRAVLTRQAQLVPDVSQDEDYIVHNEDTKSELAIPLLDNGKVIGVMDVESSELNAFDELDKDSLSLLVDLAVVALRNAEQAEQLTRSNAVGLMGAWGAEIVHDVNREVGYIRREVYLLGQQPELPAEVRDGLSVIDKFAEHLGLPEIPERLPGFESIVTPASCQIDSTIHAAMQAYRSGHPSISFQPELGCPGIRVAMHERFLFSIVRNLLRNAGFALDRILTEKTILIRSHVEGPMAVFEIEDSGPGLRPKITPLLFKQPIPHDDGRKGRGLLLVGFIVEQHGGKIEIVQNNKRMGACFRFWLPIFTPAVNTAEV
ncbi:MAG: GAF domain-containing protein, partial [Chloroflexi bacterium]